MVLKVRAMVSDKIFRNPEPSNDLVEYEVSGYLTIVFNCGHTLSPFHEVISSHDNMMMPPAKAGLQSMKSSPHLVKGPEVIIRCNGAKCEHILCSNTYKGGTS